MSHEIEVIDHLELIVIKMRGRVSCTERIEALGRALALVQKPAAQGPVAQAPACTRMLVDFRKAVAADEAFESCDAYARRLASAAELQTCRIAYLTAEACRFDHPADVLAAVRGLRPTTFTTLASALHWLLSTSPSGRVIPIGRSVTDVQEAKTTTDRDVSARFRTG